MRQIHIFTTGARISAGQLSETECTDKTQQAAQNPDGQRLPGTARHGKDGTRRLEDANADNYADNHADRVPQAEARGKILHILAHRRASGPGQPTASARRETSA